MAEIHVIARSRVLGMAVGDHAIVHDTRKVRQLVAGGLLDEVTDDPAPPAPEPVDGPEDDPGPDTPSEDPAGPETGTRDVSDDPIGSLDTVREYEADDVG